MTFSPGDRVLWPRDLRQSLIVVVVQDGRLTAKLDAAPGCAPARITDDVTHFIAAPADWQDAPPCPQALVGRFDMITLWDEINDQPVEDEKAIRVWQNAFLEWDALHRQPLLRLTFKGAGF